MFGFKKATPIIGTLFILAVFALPACAGGHYGGGGHHGVGGHHGYGWSRGYGYDYGHGYSMGYGQGNLNRMYMHGGYGRYSDQGYNGHGYGHDGYHYGYNGYTSYAPGYGYNNLYSRGGIYSGGQDIGGFFDLGWSTGYREGYGVDAPRYPGRRSQDGHFRSGRRGSRMH